MVIKLFSTFSGIGGFELGLQRAVGKENLQIVGYSEIDKYAIQTYEKNFPGHNNYGDITKILIKDLPDFDLLVGGFPCQDVSVAGKQNLQGGRTVLVEYLLQILEEKKPEYFVFENVKGLLSKKFDKFFKRILTRINQAGYEVVYKVLNTKEHGIPQNRERVFIIGSLKKGFTFEYLFPAKQKLEIFLKDILEEEVDEKYNLSEKYVQTLLKHEKKQSKEGNGFGFKPKTLIEGETANCLRAKTPDCPTDTLIQLNKPKHSNNRVYGTDGISPTLNTMQGGNRQPKIITHSLYPRTGGKVSGCTGHLKKEDGTSYCLDTSNMQAVEGLFQIRKLTPIECERLQGYTDNRTEGVSNSQRYKQLGNTVSVNVVEKIFKTIFN